MSDQVPAEPHEISLLDIYYFFKEGWKTIAVLSFVGLLAGVVVGFVLPEKFQASALIETASVAARTGTTRTITRQSVEPPTVLAEKMKQPSYYSDVTIKACTHNAVDNPSLALVNRLKPSVARNSVYVSVSYLASTSQLASTCLEHVLNDVVMNQARLSEPLISNIQVELSNAEQELKAAITERDQQRIKNKEKLAIVQSKLIAAQQFVDRFSKDSLNFNFSDPQFSASVLLVSTLIAKQNEIKDLELQINALEMEISANITDRDQAVRKTGNEVNELKNALLPPNTKEASFAAPIYAPELKAEPKRQLIAAIGVSAGFVLGVLILLGRGVKKRRTT